MKLHFDLLAVCRDFCFFNFIGLFKLSPKQVYGFPSIARRVVGSAASRSSVVLGTSLLANIGYTRYARMLPDYMPVPCEIEPWLASNGAR